MGEFVITEDGKWVIRATLPPLKDTEREMIEDLVRSCLVNMFINDMDQRVIEFNSYVELVYKLSKIEMGSL